MLAQNDSLNQWYVLRGENKYGPFEYSAMIRMLQKNEIYDYNYVWAPHLDSWSLLGELSEFSKDRLARLIENNAEMKKAFITRAFPRVDCQIPVYGHNDHLFFDGHTLSVSENGSLLLLNTPLMLPGQELMLHYKSATVRVGPSAPQTTGPSAPKTTEAFNVRAQIVRKNFTRTRINVKSGLHYAVRFLEISPAGQDVLKSIVISASKEAQQ